MKVEDPKQLGHLAAATALLALAYGASGCFPSSALGISERDVVATQYDNSRNFANYQTFAMPESVVHIADPSNANMKNPDRTYDALILSTVKSNLRALGWTYDSLGTSPGGPDVAVLVSAAATAWLGWSTVPCGTCWGWWGGWGWYPGYPGWGPGWGPRYPPWVSVPYEFETGSVFVDMLLPGESDDVNMRVPVIWSMGLNGIVESNVSSNSTRITGLIGQGFVQSPYLRDGK